MTTLTYSIILLPSKLSPRVFGCMNKECITYDNMILKDKLAQRLAVHADCEWQYMTEETKQSFLVIADDLISVVETHIKMTELPIGTTGNSIQEAYRRAIISSLKK